VGGVGEGLWADKAFNSHFSGYWKRAVGHGSTLSGLWGPGGGDGGILVIFGLGLVVDLK
jgi:hypothetical protein